MAWTDRLRESAYTSPEGGRMTFAYEDVSREIPLRNAEFEFPGVDGGYVQPNGFGSRRYPLRCFFWGDNHDLQATRFEELLIEPGTGRLEHPLYGAVDVVPTGSIGRRDDLKTAANQSIIEVTFLTTVGAVYPSGQLSPRSEIVGTLEDFDAAAADQFATTTDLRTTIAKANLKNTVRKLLRQVSSALETAASATADVRREFADVNDAINFGIDVLVGQPVLLAQQVVNLIRAPARAEAGIRSRLDGYADLITRILASAAAGGTSDSSALARIRLRVLNDFATADLYAMSAVTGSVLSALETTFTTKPEAMAAIDAIVSQLDTVVAWRDARFEGLGQVDPGGSYQALQHAVALTAGYLIQASFQLLPERRIVLDRNRTIIDLAAELYGSVDDRLDFLIDSNGLTGQQILELERGTSIVYYS